MPTPRKPTELLELSGRFKHDPQRARPVGPKSSRPLGPPPKHLVGDERATWLEIAEAAPGGVLTYADRFLLELVAKGLARSRREVLKAADLALVQRGLSLLGLTPSDRSRITPSGDDDTPKADPLAEFAH